MKKLEYILTNLQMNYSYIRFIYMEIEVIKEKCIYGSSLSSFRKTFNVDCPPCAEGILQQQSTQTAEQTSHFTTARTCHIKTLMTPIH